MLRTRSQKVTFEGSLGVQLAGRLELSIGTPRAYALFAHCFTCTKDVFAANRIATALAASGIGVLRFDFTGLGASDGDFENTNFTSNVEDLVRAADFLRDQYNGPKILIGHSLGGAAIIAAANRIPSAELVATIAAPADPAHVTRHFSGSIGEIESAGEAEVRLVGRPFRIRRQFLEDIADHNMVDHISGLRRSLMIFHSPQDEIVGIENARRIYETARHPKSFISLDRADHLLSRREDAVFVADMLAAWADRYLGGAMRPEQHGSVEPDEVVVAEAGEGVGRSRLAQVVSMTSSTFWADEPLEQGGSGLGPDPYALLLAALGACTSMTLRLYADRKKWPLDRVSVRLVHDKIHAADCAECEAREGKIDEFRRELTLTGDLDAAQRARLLEIADKCPVHRTLSAKNRILTDLA